MNNIKMLHRVFTERNNIEKIYQSRMPGLSYQYKYLAEYIDKALSNGYKLGSLEEAVNDPSTIHLTFDDGYKEHLLIAKKLKERYQLRKKDLTFCINVRNSREKTKLCTDVFYYLYHYGELDYVNAQLAKLYSNKSLTNKNYFSDFQEIKKLIFSTHPAKTFTLFENLCHRCSKIGVELPFLNQDEIIELSQIFSIASHAINHCHLTYLEDYEIASELKNSKIALEQLTEQLVDVFCYPDGVNSLKIQNYCRELGYQFALGILEPKNDNRFNSFLIPRTLCK